LLTKSIFLTIILSITLFADSKIIRLTADEYCPHNCEEQSPHQGYLVDLATEAFKLHGYHVEYSVEKSWQDAIKLSRVGEYNGIVGTSKTDAPDFIFPKTGMGEFDNCYVSRSNNPWKYSNIHSLKKQRLGAITGYGYGEQLNNYITQYKNDPLKIQFVSGNNAIKYSLTKLKQGKIDIYVDDCRVLTYNLSKRNDRAMFKISGKMNEVDTLFIAFNPKDPNSQKYADMLDNGLSKLKKSGRYKEILKTYSIKY